MKAILAVATTVVMALALALLPAPAQASGCSGSNCVGHDPVAFACSATSTKTASAFINSVAVATVWNRYSLGCNANWARAQLTSVGLSRGYTIQTKIWVNGPIESMCYPGPSNTGSSQENCYPLPGYGGSSIVYTDMVDGSSTTYAAVNVYDAGNNLVASAVQQQ